MPRQMPGEDIVYSPFEISGNRGYQGDKAKGIIAKPMPREWHDRHAVNSIEDEATRQLYRRIVADKKPYFMRYIYPDLMKKYNTYIKSTTKNALRKFQLTVDELKNLPLDSLTDEQQDFLRYYDARMPVGTHDCVMNRICRRFENEFDGYLGRHGLDEDFDYTIMKSGAEYTKTQSTAIRKLYEDYNRRLKDFAVFSSYERMDEYDSVLKMTDIRTWFEQECAKVCPNRFTLCDIILDICYTHNATKRFAWDMCGETIIENLLNNNNRDISFPILDPEGEITYCGKRFVLTNKRLEECNEHYSE